MKNIKLSKLQFEQIEAGIQIDIEIGGFLAYCIQNDYGDFETPNGVGFDVNFYALNMYDLTINGKVSPRLRDF